MEEELLACIIRSSLCAVYFADGALVAGLVSGVVALFGIRKHGREGILLKSLIGILLIIGCAALLISDIINARTKRTEAEVVPPNGP